MLAFGKALLYLKSRGAAAHEITRTRTRRNERSNAASWQYFMSSACIWSDLFISEVLRRSRATSTRIQVCEARGYECLASCVSRLGAAAHEIRRTRTRREERSSISLRVRAIPARQHGFVILAGNMAARGCPERKKIAGIPARQHRVVILAGNMDKRG